MVNTKDKYSLVEIGELKVGDIFYNSKEIEDEGFRVSKMRLSSQPNIIIGVGLATGAKLGWDKECPVYVKEDDDATD